MATDSLKQQFQALQEQQRRRLQKDAEKKKKVQVSDTLAKKDNIPVADDCEDDLDLKTATENEVPTNTILLSAELNDLQETIQELRDENGRLYKLVGEKDEELKIVKRRWKDDKKGLIGSGASSENAAQKIIELSKRVRELSAELEGEKSRNQTLLRKSKELELQNKPQPIRAEPPKSEFDLQAKELLSWKEKFHQSKLKAAEDRNELETLKKDLKIAQKVLAREIGDQVSFQSLLKESSGWKGRHQQILLLQTKVAELQQQVSDGSKSVASREGLTGFLATSAHDEKYRLGLKKIEKDRKEQKEKLQHELEIAVQERDSFKEKLTGSKARSKILSQDVKNLKEQMSTLLEKGKHDDELISALLREQQSLKEANANLRDASDSSNTRGGDRTVKGKNVQQENRLVTQLQQEIRNQEEKVKQLEEELENIKRLRNDGNKTSYSGAVADSQSADATMELQEAKSLCEAATVEKEKLMELMAILQQRNAGLQAASLEKEKACSEYRRQLVKLEKQVEKLEQAGQSNAPRVRGSASLKASSSSNQQEARISELETRLAINEDEIEALKEALQSTLKAKEDDMHMFQSMVEQTKKIFLQGLRQFRESGSR